ncbi:MAG: sugar-binding domain-containing protein, partial [Candidatus Izemoplasmatales bacterium]
MRKIVPLNFDWRFTPDYQERYLDPEFATSCLQNVMLPHSLVELPFNYLSDERHQIVGTYFRDLDIEKSIPDHIFSLYFYGVMNTCKVYLNGEKIGYHQGGYTPFEVAIETALIKESPNRLVVVVDGSETPNVPPFGVVVDYLGHSGIYREV